MTTDYFVKKVLHPTEGELYQFIGVDTETGEETIIDPFEAGMLERVGEPEPEKPELLFITSKRGADATGYHAGDKFVVTRGSKFAASTSPKCPKKYVVHRENLILDGLLVPVHKGLLLMEDVAFDSPMAAMGAVIGGWVRGPHDWKKTNKLD